MCRFLLLILALASPSVRPLPKTDLGICVEAYLAAFNAGEEAMRAFENEHRGDAALRTRSIDQRVADYRPRRERWGRLTLLRVVGSSETEIVVHVGTSESGEVYELRFEFEAAAPHKLDVIWVRAEEEIGPIADPELREELLKRMREDQRVRNDATLFAFGFMKVDAENTLFMKELVEKRGWPGKSMVGADGAEAAWLLVQHADGDRAFQKKALELIQAAYEKKEATGQELAYLTDRVLVGEGKPQRYGTQFHKVDGEQKPFPIEDEAHVDERRAAMGMSPLAEYAEQIRRMGQK